MQKVFEKWLKVIFLSRHMDIFHTKVFLLNEQLCLGLKLKSWFDVGSDTRITLTH